MSHVYKSLNVLVVDLQERDLSNVAYPYNFSDVIYIKCRDERHKSSTVLVSVIGVGLRWLQTYSRKKM